MKQLFISLSFILSTLGLFVGSTTLAQEGKVPLYFFERGDCQHCIAEEAFLSDLTNRRDDVEVITYNIYSDEGSRLWKDIAQVEGLPLATPITIVGNTVIQGFDSAETTGVLFETLIDESKGKATLSPQEIIEAGGSGSVQSVQNATCDQDSGVCATPTRAPVLITIPFLGPTDVSAYSLPTLSAILGFVDGFNPCAMWVLVTFLLILSQAKSRKKMFLIAGLFILAETVMYYLILNVWFTTWNFVGLDAFITPLVGAIAVGGGIFFLYEWATNDGTCKIVGLSQRQKIMRKIQVIVNSKLTWITALGIITLAFSVNVIEFACSIGIPQAFTKILEFNQLSFVGYQSMMLIYILFYMIDDFIVFGLALWGISKISLTAKYTHWTNFVGGILMLILGFLLILAPEVLRFV